MYQKVKVKPILELIFVGQTNTEISKTLSVSRNTVVKIRSKKLNLIFILISQYSSDVWYERLGRGDHTDYIIDRIIYNLYEVPTTKENIRKKWLAKKLIYQKN